MVPIHPDQFLAAESARRCGYFEQGRNRPAQKCPQSNPADSAFSLLALVIVIIVFLCFPLSADASPKRIISLKPNITEILFALGAGDRVVGVTKYCDYPESVKKLPRVADYVKPFTEKIITLSPDIIIGSEENSSRRSIEILRRMGFKVALFPFSSMNQTLSSIKKIGALLGMESEGEALVQNISDALINETKKRKGVERRRVLVVWGHRPMVVTGTGSFMDELLKLVGAKNVAVGSMRYPHWGTESVIAADPEIIIDMSGSMSLEDGSSKIDDEWQRLTTVSAVKNKRIYVLDDSLFRAGPRLPQAVQELSRVIYANE